ncbi:thioredoxin family protein [Stenotrophomonas sp.]|uniref:protein-disulfide reductase DsbD family protein n=1 Tax=Stenotrophomonas sp. TaxID=69392 RepID=UPI0028AEE35D|nr:thioredoxin family protein [Stenotrophomonas sp.]
MRLHVDVLRRAALTALLLLGVLLPGSVLAQVQAELVAAQRSVQPGEPLQLALRMQHDPHWHSFWKNAGTGLPTKLMWDLPPGWTAEAIQWPTPILVRDREGNITGHGYEGLSYLPVRLIAPADLKPGSEVELKAQARWLMCETVCIPGKAAVSLRVPVSSDAPEADAAVQAALAALPMPASSEGWKLAATREKDGLTLRVAAPADMADLHFFPADEFVSYKVPQTIGNRGARALLKLPLDAAETMPADAMLRGVLAYSDAQGAYRGVAIELPFVAEAEASALVGTADLGAVPTSADAAGGTQLSFVVLLFAVLGGLILNLMPCVFPVLGLKVVGFIEQAGNDRRKVSLHALSFTAGVLLSFWALAGLLAVLREGGQQLGWGFQLQSAPFVFVLALVMLAFAMNLSGVFEVGMRATGIGSGLQTRTGVAGSFFSGMLATVVATPCSAPFLAPALGAALALPTAQSFVVFTAIALGLALPYLLLSVFPSLVKLLPRPGAWMETFKQLMAFPLYATVAYLLWVLAGQLHEAALLNALLALALLGFGLWLYGRATRPGARGARARLSALGGVLVLAAAVLFGWPRAPAPEQLQWEAWSSERVQQLQAEGRPIYVDFTARWCATCQVNKKVVFASARVRDYFREHNVAALKADWTNADPLITAELERWNRSAVPFNLAYPAGGGAPRELPEVLTPEIVLSALDNATPQGRD